MRNPALDQRKARPGPFTTAPINKGLRLSCERSGTSPLLPPVRPPQQASQKFPAFRLRLNS
jgi:hypothetical protein